MQTPVSYAAVQVALCEAEALGPRVLQHSSANCTTSSYQKSLALTLAKSDNARRIQQLSLTAGVTMAATNGLEKFSHLEDKIYRTIELTKALRQENDDLERQLATARQGGNDPELTVKLDKLLAQRDEIR